MLIARELRLLGNLRGAEELLAQVMQTQNGSVRADALAERAQLRMHQQRHREALADLRAADAHYAQLNLDFDRIDSSSALALALLDAGDLAGAGSAADTAVAMERRIRVKAANPEMRARFLSASYAPYEARIEVDLAAAPADRGSGVACIPHRRDHPRTFARRSAGAHGARRRHPARRRDRAAAPGDDRVAGGPRETRAREYVDEDALLETRRRIDATRARLEARMLRQDGVQAGTSSPSPSRGPLCRRRCPMTRQYWRSSSAIGARMAGC